MLDLTIKGFTMIPSIWKLILCLSIVCVCAKHQKKNKDVAGHGKCCRFYIYFFLKKISVFKKKLR